jgi:hypothetical protein
MGSANKRRNAPDLAQSVHAATAGGLSFKPSAAARCSLLYNGEPLFRG